MQRLLPGHTRGGRGGSPPLLRGPRQGGGYILGPAHLFQPDVPPENILAMYADAVAATEARPNEPCPRPAPESCRAVSAG